MATVLVVDDHPTNREVLVTLLNTKGHRPLEAADGAEALALVRSERPDLVISDILMPTMDGYEFVRQLRADAAIAHTEVIFYTSHYLEQEARDLAGACGVHRVLSKPSRPKEILHAIDQALAHRPPEVLAPVEQRFDREHLRLMTDKLSAKIAELQATNLRLTALTAVNLGLASERDPRVLLDHVCRDSRDLVRARFAILCVRDKVESEGIHFASSGFDAAAAAQLPLPRIDGGIFAEVLQRSAARRASRAAGDLEATGLPAGYPDVHSLLVAPITSLHSTYGWICLLDKVGLDAFSDDDEKLLSMAAAQVGRIYETGSLYAEIRRLNLDLENRVAERTAELSSANEELEAFDYSISHDLRGPLGRIRGFSVALLEDHSDELDAQGRDYLRRIADSAERMDQIVGDLLGLATLSRDAMHRGNVDLSALAEEILGALRRSDPGRDVDTIVPPGIRANADAGLLRIALENLLGNAWKFTSKTAAPRIEVGMDSGDRPEFWVRDNGAGFDPAQSARLFHPFRRLHSEGEFEGTGIGLATVKRIITRHGGRVWAEGAVGRGATFRFTLSP